VSKFKKTRQTATLAVSVPPPGISYNDLFEKTKEKMGNFAFTGYDARRNNCQRFVWSMLEANGLATEGLKAFIVQDAEAIFRKMPAFAEKIGKTLTDAAAVADRVIEGQGKREAAERAFKSQRPVPEPEQKKQRIRGPARPVLDGAYRSSFRERSPKRQRVRGPPAAAAPVPPAAAAAAPVPVLGKRPTAAESPPKRQRKRGSPATAPVPAPAPQPVVPPPAAQVQAPEVLSVPPPPPPPPPVAVTQVVPPAPYPPPFPRVPTAQLPVANRQPDTSRSEVERQRYLEGQVDALQSILRHVLSSNPTTVVDAQPPQITPVPTPAVPPPPPVPDVVAVANDDGFVDDPGPGAVLVDQQPADVAPAVPQPDANVPPPPPAPQPPNFPGVPRAQQRRRVAPPPLPPAPQPPDFPRVPRAQQRRLAPPRQPVVAPEADALELQPPPPDNLPAWAVEPGRPRRRARADEPVFGDAPPQPRVGEPPAPPQGLSNPQPYRASRNQQRPQRAANRPTRPVDPRIYQEYLQGGLDEDYVTNNPCAKKKVTLSYNLNLDDDPSKCGGGKKTGKGVANHSYREFVRKEMRQRPPDVSAKDFMRSIAAKWREGK
jgi:hypothetical protein